MGMQVKHIQDYYTYEMKHNGMSADTVIHRHENIRKALHYAYKTGLINSNPADCVQRPRKEKFQASFYNERPANKSQVEISEILAAQNGYTNLSRFASLF